MFQKPYFLPGFVFLVLTAILHVLAVIFHLYWDFWWFDSLVHLLAGICVALMSLWFFYFSNIVKSVELSSFGIFVRLIFITLIVGIIWEIFEFQFGISFRHSASFFVYVFETASDLIMDLIGAIVIGFIATYRLEDLTDKI